MKIPKLYLDTSIFNFAIATDVISEKEATLKLFDEFKKRKYEAYISEIVLREINRAPQIKATALKNQIAQINPVELILEEDSQALADEYIKREIIPAKYENDALHVAIASVNNLDVIISWNFSHIVKFKTKKEVTGINIIMGYKPIEILSPWEVIENE